MSVTIAIKALNEETAIRTALESAIAAAGSLGGKVVLADSISTDRTLTIARSMTARIVQLADPADRGCGAGAQLGYQAVDTPFFYLMDGDMALLPKFLPSALKWLEAHPDYAGVGGQVIERVVENEEFRIRAAAMEHEDHRREGPVDRLDGGGLYRTEAIRALGYFCDRNLASFEEFELAARLHARGWKLGRVVLPAVEHSGHRGNGYRLMWERLRSGQLSGVGQVLRSAWGKPHMGFVLRRLTQVRSVAATACWWVAIVVAVLTAPRYPALPLLAFLLPAPVAALSWRRRSVRLGLYSFCYWNMAALGTILGLFQRRLPPELPLASVEISPRDGFRQQGCA
ncbi:MAG TPA: glycosyltransferase [Novosphingobium sp.]|nr:glycosyltransferase [Novosphingobium sp.]